jgi:nucleoside-diphosphate-sugar epimerase
MLDKMARMIAAHRYLLVGPGDNVLHHTYVDDIVQGVLLAASSPAAIGEDFILAGPETTTLRQLSELVARVLGVRLPRVHVPLAFARSVATLVDVAAYRGLAFAEKEPPINHEKLDVMTVPIAFDASKAQRVLGYAPRVGYEEGVRRTLGVEAMR